MVIQSEMASFSVLHLWVAFVAQQLIACPFRWSSSFKIHALCTETLTQHWEITLEPFVYTLYVIMPFLIYILYICVMILATNNS